MSFLCVQPDAARSAEASRAFYEEENNRKIAELSSQVSMLKEVHTDTSLYIFIKYIGTGTGTRGQASDESIADLLLLMCVVDVFQLTIDIGTEVRTQNSLLDDMVRPHTHTHTELASDRGHAIRWTLLCLIHGVGWVQRMWIRQSRRLPHDDVYVCLLQGGGFNKADGLLGNTMRRLNTMLSTTSGRHMLVLIGFIVFVFFAVYWIVKR